MESQEISPEDYHGEHAIEYGMISEWRYLYDFITENRKHAKYPILVKRGHTLEVNLMDVEQIGEKSINPSMILRSYEA